MYLSLQLILSFEEDDLNVFEPSADLIFKGGILNLHEPSDDLIIKRKSFKCS